VLQELAVNLRRTAKRPLDAKATRDLVTDYLAWHVVVNSGESASDMVPIVRSAGDNVRGELMAERARRPSASIARA